MLVYLLSLFSPTVMERLRDTFSITPGDVLDLVLRVFIVYLVLLLGIRLTGKREVGQMTPFDLVLLLLISNAVQNAMIGPYNALTAGLVAALTLLVINRGMSRLVLKNRKWRRRIEGSPTLLVYDGEINWQAMGREGISETDLRAALREHGVEQSSQVHMAVLEIDGNISVIQKDEMPSTARPHHHFKFLNKNA
ncbi:MAG: YetF domain-containing protein [Terriglobia bacterium]